MEDGGTSVQPSGVVHLIGGALVVCGGAGGGPACVWALQTAATHLMKSPFCASLSSALPRILKKSVELSVVTIAAMILPSLAWSALSGSPARSTMVTSPNEVCSRCAISPSFCSVIGG